MPKTQIPASPSLSNVRYEIRGRLARRAHELERLGYEIISLNIGNPGAYGFRTPETMRLAMIENMPSARDPAGGPDRALAMALEHRGFQIVVKHGLRRALKEGEGTHMPLEEARKALVEKEAHEDHPRVAENHHEGGQPPLATLDRPCPEAGPVHLRLLAGQCAQLEVGLGRAPWS